MTLTRIKALESFGLNGIAHNTAWEDRLSELADYRKSTGTAMFLELQRKHALAHWVGTQRSNTGCT
jgi:hypothetical protein